MKRHMFVLPTIRAFEPGKIVATTGAISQFNGDFLAECLRRHLRGDWGNISKDDQEANNRAVQLGDRLLSVYLANDRKLWIITEADRSTTTLLVPEEY